MRGHRTLSAHLLATQVAVLAITSVVGFSLWALRLRHELDGQYEQRALAIAHAVAATPDIRTAMAGPVKDPDHTVASLAELMRARTGASYVVVLDMNRVRYSHPTRALIGKRVTEPIVVRDGRGHVGIDHGDLGRSANGKAPIFGPDATVVGEVSVGVLEKRVSSDLWTVLPSLAGYLALALAVGVAAAYLLARRLKRQTFGLELDEIAALVQEREATLHGIREGVLALDTAGRVTLINDQASQLLGVTLPAAGRHADELFPPGRLRELLTGPATEATDQLVLLHGRLLVVSRTPVVHRGVDLGSVITVRDRTELDNALRELDEVRSLTDALRAQQHEFANRMHVIAGLLDLDLAEDARRYAEQIEGATAGTAAELEAKIADPRIVGLLLAKATVAAERGVTLEVTCASRVDVDSARADALVSILGNLIDNGIEAAAGGGGDGPPAVVVRISADPRDLVIDICDTGPGIPAGSERSIFSDGWSTKRAAAGGRPRGLGLALVRQLVDRLGGTIAVREGQGARFEVHVPLAAGVPDGARR